MIRLRTEEEVAAKRTRRKKREREKGKKKGNAAEGELVDEPIGEVKWEERLTIWCTVRANAKVKSFSFPPDDVGTEKTGIPVGVTCSVRCYADSSSFFSRWQITLSRRTPFHPRPAPGKPPSSPMVAPQSPPRRTR